MKLKFVTNTTKESKKALHQRLNNIGFNIKEKEIFSSLSAAKNLVVKQNLHPYFMLSSDAMKDFEEINKDGQPDSVLIGLAPELFDYEHMTQALR